MTSGADPAGAWPVNDGDPVGAFALDEGGEPLFGAFGGGLGLRPGELDLLLADLGVGGERGELAADLRLDLLDAVLQFVDLQRVGGGGLVAEEPVDRTRVEQIAVVAVSWFAEHGVSLHVCGVNDAYAGCERPRFHRRNLLSS